MQIIKENNNTPAGEMSWVIIKDQKDQTIGNIGLIDFVDDRLKYRLQKIIANNLKCSLTIFNEYGIF